MAKKEKKINKPITFGKIVLGSAVGIILAMVAFSLIWSIFFSIIVGIASLSKSTPEESVLTIKLDREIVEQQQGNGFSFNFAGLQNSSSLGLNKILKAIKSAKTDENIKGIFMDLYLVSASYADISEIRSAIKDFKTSGKFVIAHANIYTQNSYYLATVADKIYLTPTGSFLWKGLSASVIYYKGLFDKLEIEPEIIRHGKYKSAVEPYMQDTMSVANREQLQTLFNNFWDIYTKEIAEARSLDSKALNLYADSLLVNSSKQAVALGFVDKEIFKNDVIDEIKELLGVESDEKLETISLSKYIKSISSLSGDEKTLSKDKKIAIIYADGEIIDGKNFRDKIGSKTISAAFKKAASDSTVKAIVLRINSPGGSALASEIMLHEIIKTKTYKPIVVSMGKYAASGGYYIACYGDKIYAEPYTLTGSIGVFGLTFNLQKLANNKLGINVEVVKTNTNSDIGNLLRPLSLQERNFLQTQVENTYDIFITHVAQGRGLTKSYVDSIGQGRVWTATAALSNGLIDEIGSIDSAISQAAILAALGDDYKIVEYPKEKDFFTSFLENYQMKMTKMKLGNFYDTYEKIQDLQTKRGIQTRMLWDIEID